MPICILYIKAILSQFDHKLKAKPSLTEDDSETVDLPLDLEIEGQLDMFEMEVNGEGVGDEEPDVNLEDDGASDEIAEDVASSDTATVTEIIQDAEKSIRLDPVPSDEVNVGRVSVAKVSIPNILSF